MKYIAAHLLILLALHTFAQNSFFQDADNFFQNYVTVGLVNYDSITKNPGQLNRLVNEIADYVVIGKSPEEQKAFYTNAYNILVIKQIIDNYPTPGPMDIDGFFNETSFNVAGRKVTLDELEKEILFRAFPDPRLHFILVCAAMGCPPIADYAYTPASLDSLIEHKTKEVLNINWYVRVYKKKTQISNVFEWYKENFLNDTTSIKSYINQYRDLQIPDEHTLDVYEYDWSLNDSKNMRY